MFNYIYSYLEKLEKVLFENVGLLNLSLFLTLFFLYLLDSHHSLWKRSNKFAKYVEKAPGVTNYIKNYSIIKNYTIAVSREL